MRRLFAALMLALALCVCAQQRVNPSEISFSENLEQPAVPKKAQKPIADHMLKILQTLHKSFPDVELFRDGEGIVVTMPCSQLFAPNSTEISEQGKPYLRAFNNLLKYPSMYKVIVAVHSDDTGEPAYNDALTEQRANAIDDFLCKESGQSGENVVPYGMGADDPLAPNNTVANRAKNRRVEIYILPEWQMIEQARAGRLR